MFETSLSIHTWKRFVNEGVLDSSRLNQRLVESWYRSREANVNPYMNKGRYILTDDLIYSKKEENSLLRNIALPHVNKMNQFINSLGMIALLIDPEGYVLSISGNSEVQNEASKINFVEGVRWTEGEVGTNAIGTALSIEEPIMVTGMEHYSVASHNWSCSASPIRNNDGKVIGILDVSCPMDRAHPYMLGIVTSVAYAIEREISIQIHKDEMELVLHSVNVIDAELPVVICNHMQVIICASKSIRKNIPNWMGLKVNEMAEYGFSYRKEVPIISKLHGRVIGNFLYLLNINDEINNSVDLSKVPSISFDFKGEVGTSKSFQHTLYEMKRVAHTDAIVCILGETGTGKEVIAQAIHENSTWKDGPFVAVNCGAIPKELTESELFGYTEGAFTGARRHGYKGKFEQAYDGTIFLDEIGEITHSMQVALLRVLQERKVTPVGSMKEIPLNIRIIAATHRDLRQLVNEGKFREDLYYRLHVYPIHVPPLRERKEDIPHFVQYFCKKNHWNISLPPEFFDRLMEYHWPGNIRELMNVLEHLHILFQSEIEDSFETLNWMDVLDLNKGNHSEAQLLQEKMEVLHYSASLTLREKIQKEQMTEALQKTRGNVLMAAKLLGVPRSTFYKRLKKFDVFDD